jgi:hypothetical protein
MEVMLLIVMTIQFVILGSAIDKIQKQLTRIEAKLDAAKETPNAKND